VQPKSYNDGQQELRFELKRDPTYSGNSMVRISTLGTTNPMGATSSRVQIDTSVPSQSKFQVIYDCNSLPDGEWFDKVTLAISDVETGSLLLLKYTVVCDSK